MFMWLIIVLDLDSYMIGLYICRPKDDIRLHWPGFKENSLSLHHWYLLSESEWHCHKINVQSKYFLTMPREYLLPFKSSMKQIVKLNQSPCIQERKRERESIKTVYCLKSTMVNIVMYIVRVLNWCRNCEAW